VAVQPSRFGRRGIAGRAATGTRPTGAAVKLDTTFQPHRNEGHCWDRLRSAAIRFVGETYYHKPRGILFSSPSSFEEDYDMRHDQQHGGGAGGGSRTPPVRNSADAPTIPFAQRLT
jgi:hypothetical protein